MPVPTTSPATPAVPLDRRPGIARSQRLVLLALVLLVVAVNIVATRQWLTAPFPGHNDFLTPWEAARSFWLEGIPVYSDASNENIQVRIYGRPIEAGEFPNYYAYPFYTIVPLWPLVHLPYDWASAVWMVALEVCLVAALALLLDLYRWRPGPPALALLVVWALVFYPAARGLILGQVSHAVYLAQLVAVWALLRRRDHLAGVALALSTCKPQMSYLLVPVLLFWALRERRFGTLRAFALVFGGLLAASFLLQPTWVGDWLFELRRYTDYTAVGSPVWVVTQYYLGLGAAGEWAVNAVFYALLLWVWVGVIVRRRTDHWLWAVMLTLAVTHLVAPRTATTHFVVLVAPLVFYMARFAQRGRGWLSLVLLVALLVVPWWHFLLTVDGEFEHPATYLLLPFGTVALLLATRSWWVAAASRLSGLAG